VLAEVTNHLSIIIYSRTSKNMKTCIQHGFSRGVTTHARGRPFSIAKDWAAQQKYNLCNCSRRLIACISNSNIHCTTQANRWSTIPATIPNICLSTRLNYITSATPWRTWRLNSITRAININRLRSSYYFHDLYKVTNLPNRINHGLAESQRFYCGTNDTHIH
jgi:hypothetical protein